MIRRRLVYLVFAVALTPSVAGWGQTVQPSQSARPITPWDPAKVATLAQQFAVNIGQLRREFANLPQPASGSDSSRAYLGLSDDLRVIESEARELAARASQGASQDEAYPIYRRVRSMVLDARGEARKYEFPMSVKQGIAEARALLIQLDPYFD